jgi:hypothetical protein
MTPIQPLVRLPPSHIDPNHGDYRCGPAGEDVVSVIQAISTFMAMSDR